ncbi:glutathione ABC transporter permease GsiD [Salmonella enterica subsp. enterica]|uniref:Glutathione ABC transporter permease GsiD n=1 Tax=Salmonella enterica I TaxID=59201 RepID=A0A379WY07_SALET|nr:glutathione ABC transporter permease GsiD [Salmonella enterica subsp. enterica]
MRLFNWRRQAILHAMPVVKPDQIRTPWREFWRRFRRQHVALVAGGFVLALILVAIFAPLADALRCGKHILTTIA